MEKGSCVIVGDLVRTYVAKWRLRKFFFFFFSESSKAIPAKASPDFTASTLENEIESPVDC